MIYQITKKGIDILRHYFLDVDFKRYPVSINLGTLYHDLLLTDVLRIFKRRCLNRKIVNSKFLNFDKSADVQVPDAVLFLPNGKGKVAIELELTVKSEMRYRDIILNYRTNSDFKAVIYVTLNKAIQNKVGGIITGHLRHYQNLDDTDLFYFATLESVLNKPNCFKVCNGKNNLFEQSVNFNHLTKEVYSEL